jgi:TolA-binding protein
VIRRWLVDKPRPDDARVVDDELLARTLQPATRAWVLLVSAELARQSGQADEARNRLELVRQSPAVPRFGFQAGLRLAELDFDTREFARAEASAKSLLSEALPDELRAAVLLLAAEAAYWARDYTGAAGFYTRFLADFPKHPAAAQVGMALGWAEFRLGRMDMARQRWTSFASEMPADPRAAEALLLSAELAAKAGDLSSAQRLLADVILRFPATEQAQVATLNRAILAINASRAAEALPELLLLAERAPHSSYIGRVRLAKGVALLSMGRLAEAPPDFQAALAQGEDAISHLGLGVLAFERGDGEAAAREFSAAREVGSAEIAATAEYGLAAAAFNQRKMDEFKRLAPSLLARRSDPRITPNVLYGMSAVAADEKRWPEARELALRVTTEFPGLAVAAAALGDVGSAAGADAQWPLAREMYETLAKRHPNYHGNVTGRLVFAESLLRTGAAADARRELEIFVKGSARDARIPQALLLLAEAQEAAGNRAEALELYTRVDREYPRARGDGSILLKAARLLEADRRWPEAKTFLERALNQGDSQLVTEAAYRLGEGLRGAGQNEEAVEAYMTAAYIAPDSKWARRALLGAGQSFGALRQNDSAIIVYRKLLRASGLEPDLAATARSRLNALGAN